MLTWFALVGAAVSFAAYLAMRHARRIARASDWLTHVPRPRLAAFLAFALVAMMYAQKRNGELRMGNGELRNLPDSPLYILHSTFTNAAYSYAMPSNAVRHEKWWRRGACFRKCKMENVERRMSA